MKNSQENKAIMSFGALALLLILGVGFSSAQTATPADATGSDGWDVSSKAREQKEMPSSKNLPTELTPPGESIEPDVAVATWTPAPNITPIPE
jgi:hypothetical protein